MKIRALLFLSTFCVIVPLAIYCVGNGKAGGFRVFLHRVHAGIGIQQGSTSLTVGKYTSPYSALYNDFIGEQDLKYS